MKAIIIALCATALSLPAHAQIRGRGGVPARPMGARSASVSRFGFRPMPRPTAGFSVGRPFPGSIPASLVGHRHGLVITSLPFNPFFHNRFFIDGGFFRTPFCFRNPFFCHKLFLRRFLFFSNFGAFNAFPIGGLPMIAPAPFLTGDPVATDTTTMQQESAAIAELQRDLQDERLRQQDLEQELIDLRTAEKPANTPKSENEPTSPTAAPPTVLVLRNGTCTEVQNYAWAKCYSCSRRVGPRRFCFPK